MAKVKTPLLSYEGTGTIGENLTFQRYPKGIKVYPYKKHADAKSNLQLTQRSWFTESRKYWNLLSQADKDFWETQKGAKYISAYHAWLAWSINNIALVADEHTVGLWHMNEQAWDGTAGEVRDTSIYANHGTAQNNLTTTKNLLGKCGNFNGTDHYVLVPHHSSLNLTTAITMEAIIRTPSTPIIGGIIDKYVEEYNYGLLLFKFNSDQHIAATLWILEEEDVLEIISDAILPNTIYYIAATFNGTTLYLYLNGSQVKESTMPGSIWISENNIEIGRVWLSYYFRGLNDEVRISNIARTRTEISATWARIQKLLRL